MRMCYRKPKPSAPHWFWWGMDGCWNCKTRNGCNKCWATRYFKGIRRELIAKAKERDEEVEDE